MSMRQAVALAWQGRGQASPNPMVGAVLERDGEIVGRGFHTYAGLKHAEIVALEEAGDRAKGATLYVTLEPCSHVGRTGPCADAVIAAGVSRVIAAAEDPNPLVAGDGFRKLRVAGVAVQVEPSEEADKLNEAFVHSMRHKRPLVTLKTALTLDGKIAAPDDNRGWITSPIARDHVQQLRHDSDAILTGIGTVLADDCFLTDRSGLPRSRPLLRIVLDSLLRLPLASQMVKSANKDLVVIATSAASPDRKRHLEELGVQVLLFDGANGRADIRQAVDWLGQQRYLSLLVEAGSKVNWAVLEAEAADKIYFYYAPKILGGTESLPMAGGWAGGAGAMPSKSNASLCTLSLRMNLPWRAMFTGIIEEVGRVRQSGNRLIIEARLVTEDLVPGGSIAVNGVCLTAVEIGTGHFAADLAPETLDRSNLGDLAAGSIVNLERPVTLQQRLSGHLVQGHVDATAVIEALDSLPNGNWWLRVKVPAPLIRYIVEKGSVALDGISLTVAQLDEGSLSAAIIPHTFESTTLRTASHGYRMNLECDILAKHVERLMSVRSVS